jgi:hypothetical protein
MLSYDLNGNMLSDGTNAFTWNARNQVASLNSVSLTPMPELGVPGVVEDVDLIP